MTATAVWRVALRLARRTVRRSPGRMLLVAALVALPVSGAAGLDLVLRTVAPAPEAYARWHLGSADAHLEVTPYAHTELHSLSRNGVLLSSPGEPGAPDRDPVGVDVTRLLPAGTGVYPAAATRPVSVRLAAGDHVVHVDADLIDTRSAQTAGMTLLRHGRLPEAPDEIAVTPGIASRLRLTTSAGEPRPGARVRLSSGRNVRVVGVAERPDCLDCDTAVGVPGGLLSGLGRPQPARLVTFDRSVTYLLDLPELPLPEMRELVTRLGAEGIALLPRTAITQPDAWQGVGDGIGHRIGQASGRNDLTGRAGLLVGFGLLEVVLLAGTAFTVGVRRQVRELGMLAAVGATPRDLRRTVLAQGVLLGAVGALGGIALGVAGPPLARPLLERVFAVELATWAFAPLDYLLLAVLGMLSGLAATVVPAYGAGRLDPVLALIGRFETRLGASAGSHGWHGGILCCTRKWASTSRP